MPTFISQPLSTDVATGTNQLLEVTAFQSIEVVDRKILAQNEERTMLALEASNRIMLSAESARGSNYGYEIR